MRKYTLTVDEAEPYLANVVEIVGVLMAYDTPLAQIEQAIDLPVGESMQHETLFIARVEET